eukprot:scaffold7413_cov258-Pinguiococcus_pyrenoidosus.AAC.1
MAPAASISLHLRRQVTTSAVLHDDAQLSAVAFHERLEVPDNVSVADAGEEADLQRTKSRRRGVGGVAVLRH